MELSAGECYTNTKVVAALTKAAADGGELEEAVRDCTRLSSAQIHEAYVATVNGTRMLVALDNWAAESLIDITVDVSGMDVLTDDEMLILGVDGSGTKTRPLLKVPCSGEQEGSKAEIRTVQEVGCIQQTWSEAGGGQTGPTEVGSGHQAGGQ